jgi:hypothetical protein
VTADVAISGAEASQRTMRSVVSQCESCWVTSLSFPFSDS